MRVAAGAILRADRASGRARIGLWVYDLLDPDPRLRQR